MQKANRLEYLETLPKVSGYQQASLPVAIPEAIMKNCDWAEFGVGSGYSTERIYERLPRKTELHLFDSFNGLPEDWRRREGHTLREGHFRCDPPKWIFEKDRIIVHKGLFKETIPVFADEQENPLGFINVDCDLYSSTKDIFDYIDHLITIGTVIHFDEFYNFDSWEKHEFKAFMEYCTNWDRDFKYLGRTNRNQVWIKMVR